MGGLRRCDVDATLGTRAIICGVAKLQTRLVSAIRELKRRNPTPPGRALIDRTSRNIRLVLVSALIHTNYQPHF
jgi:hypothetical protein